jgi:ABC-2 type transport system ATP-binding protein
MIELLDVSRKYGEKTAVNRLSLVIPQGELFAFLGPNGAGKTTTIKMLVGLLRPSAGAVRLCGFDLVTQTREAQLRLSYVPDQPHLYDKLTGREFLQFVVDLFGLPRQLGAERIEREIVHFELADFVDDLTESYSHGMKQRLVFASALLHDPQVLVIDEPMVGLDPRSMRVVKDLLREQASHGTTIFMSTHTLDIAEEIADRIGIIVGGQLRFLGTVTELEAQLELEGTSLERLFLTLTDEQGEPPGSGVAQPTPPNAPRVSRFDIIHWIHGSCEHLSRGWPQR